VPVNLFDAALILHRTAVELTDTDSSFAGDRRILNWIYRRARSI